MKTPQPRKVTLSGEQAELCEVVLTEKLIGLSKLLANGKDESGQKSTLETKRLMVEISLELQLTLMAFGLTSSDLEEIVKD